MSNFVAKSSDSNAAEDVDEKRNFMVDCCNEL